MIIRYQLTEQEAIEGLFKNRKIRVGGWLLIVIVAIVIAVVGIVLACSNYPPSHRESASSFYFGCGLIGFSLLLPAYQPRATHAVFAKLVRSNPAFTAPKEIWFDTDKLTSVSPTRKTEVTWAHFKKITEDEDHFYLHHDEHGNVALLPKRAFDAESLREFLRCSQSVPRV